MHWLLFLAVIPLAIVHGAGLAMIGAAFWFFDLVVRLYVVYRNKKRVLNVELTQIPPGLIKICFENYNFHYKAGQYLFICVPALSIFEWHPISLSSCPNEKVVSMHIRVLGDWTKKLYDMSSNPMATTKIWIDGPYGNCKVDVEGDEYKMFILVSGGVGVTPLQSMCNQLMYEHLRGRNIKKIMFIWSVKDKFLYESIADNPDAYYLKKLPAKLPFSFQPDGMLKHEHEHVLESYFHLTYVRDKEEYQKANIDPIKQNHVRFGRPKLQEYFEKMINYAEGYKEKKIAVLCCGPENLMVECGKLCLKNTKNGISFDFHEETFDF